MVRLVISEDEQSSMGSIARPFYHSFDSIFDLLKVPSEMAMLFSLLWYVPWRYIFVIFFNDVYRLGLDIEYSSCRLKEQAVNKFWELSIHFSNKALSVR